MGSCQSNNKNNVCIKKEDIREYVDVANKSEEALKRIEEIDKVISFKDNKGEWEIEQKDPEEKEEKKIDANANTDVNVDVNTNTDVNIDANANADADVNVNANVDANTDVNVDVNTNTDVNIDANANANADADVNVNANVDAKVDAHVEKKKKIIILNGAPGSGKDTQCAMILKKYNLKNITSSELLKKFMEEKKEKLNEDSNNENQITEQDKNDLECIEKCINEGLLVNDDIIIRIMHSNLYSYLNNDECDGILINGFPRTEEQARLFKNNGFKVDALINISVSKDCLLDRINRRLVDPVSNINYDKQIIELIKKKKDGVDLSEEEENLIRQNESYNSINDEVINRLIKRVDDKADIFDKRYNLYKESEEKIISFFSDVHTKIDGENTIDKVFSEISAIIDEI